MITIIREPKEFDFTGNELPFELQGNLSVEDYSFVGKLQRIEDTGLITEVAQFNLIPDDDLIAKVKIGTLLKDYLVFRFPVINLAKMARRSVAQYSMAFAEKYRLAGNLVTTPFLGKDYFFFRGKIPFTKYTGFDLTVFSSTDKNFLTLIDYDIYIWNNACFFLYYLFNGLDQDVYLRLRLFYTDRSNEEMNVYMVGAQNNELLQVPCSLNQLRIDQPVGRSIYKYEIALVDSENVAFTKWMTFFVIDKPLYARQFAFLNRFGVTEFFITKGKGTEKLKTKRSEFKRDIPLPYISEDAEIISDVEESYNAFEIETGSITKMEAQNLSHMFDSDFLYEIIDDKYVRCILVAGTTEIVPDDEDLFSVKFSYRYAFDR